RIEIKGSSGLSKEEVERMTREAESHKEDDKKRRELIDLKNQAEGVAYNAEKELKDLGERVPGEDRGKIESLISRVREAGKGDDATAIKRALEELNAARSKVGESLYQQAAAAGGPGAGRPGAAGEHGGAGVPGDGAGATAGAGAGQRKGGEDVI